MNIIFFGSGKISIPAFEALLSSRNKICCVVTQPDAKKGRGLAESMTPVKALAQAHSVEVFQPATLKDDFVFETLKKYNPDLFVVIAYGQLLPEKILNIPKIFSVNAHASLLPEYRGAAPINWALINGEKKTGVSIIKMVKVMDAGPIIRQKEIAIMLQDNALTLENKLANLAAEELIQALISIEQKNYKLKEQDEAKVSFAPKLKKEDGRIDWEKPAEQIINLIRGCAGWPGSFTYYKGKILKIYQASVRDSTDVQGGVNKGQISGFSEDSIIIATGRGTLAIQELQIEGKKRMSAREFLSGHQMRVGEIFGKK
ncbi:MAG: methionyl-tRNA formyltransferase [Candidatus Omnitrophota bacterium]|nr:MAG: methionyl-tRNA formyltransferase [Candidatus Omnitrophota bacterium]